MKIFGPYESLAKTAASRLQRWAIILAEYDFDLQHIHGKDNVVADCLSRLPCPLTPEQQKMIVHAVDSVAFDPCELIPICAKDVAHASKLDPEINLAMSYTLHGWPDQVKESLTPFSRVQTDLNVEHGYLLRGSRVVIPQPFRSQLLADLHDGHLGVNRMKAVARSFIWWPGIDGDIERLVAGCNTCQQQANRPAKEMTHPWAYPAAAFDRVHLDYAEFNNAFYLVLVDAYSKYLDVFEQGSSATASRTIAHLLRFISIFGLPRTIVTDNRPQFVSQEFQQFCVQNGIRHQRTPPYHPSSNGQCERMVQELKKCLRTRPKEVSVSIHLSRFLFKYRSTPHSTTDQTPASLLFKKTPTTRLSLLLPSFAAAMQAKQSVPVASPSREFSNGDYVWLYNARPGSKPKWGEGTVIERLGPLTYLVSVAGINRHVHVEHLRRRTSSTAVPVPPPVIQPQPFIVSDTQASSQASSRQPPQDTPLPSPARSTPEPVDPPTRTPPEPSPVNPPVQPSCQVRPPSPTTTPQSPAATATPRRNPARDRKPPVRLDL